MKAVEGNGDFEEVDPFELLEKRNRRTVKKVDPNESNDEDEDSDFDLIDTDASIKRRIGRRAEYSIPDPIYNYAIKNVGDVQGKSKLEQAM